MPADDRADLRRQLAPYRRAFPAVRWTRPDTWHLTLLFLGSVPPGRVAELERVVDTVAGQLEPYEVVVDRGGGRVRRSEGVAWLGLSVGAGTLISVATLCAATCPAEMTDGPPARRTPSAHLTVARKADRNVVDALRQRTHGPLSISWRVDRIRLVRSHLESGGVRYETMYEATM